MNSNSSIEEVCAYLDSMKSILNCKEGRLVVIPNRDKNEIFAYLYQLRKPDIKKVLLSIQPKEFEEKRYSTHSGHLNEVLYIWSPTRRFTAQDGSEVEEKMYIKTHINEEKKEVVVISFHRYADFD